MVHCFAVGCDHGFRRKNQKCKFFRFPSDKRKRGIWIKNCRRADKEPTENDRLCSCHFVDEDRNREPTIFSFNAAKKLNFSSPPAKKRRRKDIHNSNQLPSDVSGTSQCDVSDADYRPPFSTSRIHGLSSNTISSETTTLQNEIQLQENEVADWKRKYELLFEQNQGLLKDIERLEQGRKMKCPSFETLSVKPTNSKLWGMYTGLSGKRVFLVLFDFCKRKPLRYAKWWTVVSISEEEQLFMTLCKLRLNWNFSDLAFRYGVSNATITNIFRTWLDALHENVYLILMSVIPSTEHNKLALPECFEKFSNTRVILDCTDITCEASRKDLDFHCTKYSNYKSRTTFKTLIGSSPAGTITFVSDPYPGSISDKEIVLKSKILDQLVPGDAIMADKGFLLEEELPLGVALYIPPFKTTPRLTVSQVERGSKVAKARVHVERAIEKLKRFRILDLIPGEMSHHATKIIQTCAGLMNWQSFIMKEVETKTMNALNASRTEQ